MPERTYTEEEVTKLIERAAALQKKARADAPERPGLTFAELERVAADAGLDPAHLRQAAQEMATSGASAQPGATQVSATHLSVERRVPGPLTDEAWEDIVAEMRHRFDSAWGDLTGLAGYGTGQAEQAGRTRTWKHTSMNTGYETHLMMRSRGGETHLRVSQRIGWAHPAVESATYAAGAALIATVFAFNAISTTWVALLVPLLVFLTVASVVYPVSTTWRTSKRRDLESLADSLATLARPALAPSATDFPYRSSSPGLSFSEDESLTERSTERPPPAQRRRTSN